MTHTDIAVAKLPETPALARWCCPFDGWRLFAWAVAALVLVPVVVSFSSFTQLDRGTLAHLAEFVLPELIVNTIWLLLGVGFGVSLLGVSLAWLVYYSAQVFLLGAEFTWVYANLFGSRKAPKCPSYGRGGRVKPAT